MFCKQPAETLEVASVLREIALSMFYYINNFEGAFKALYTTVNIFLHFYRTERFTLNPTLNDRVYIC